MLKSLHQAKSPILVEFIYAPVALSNSCIFTSHGSMLGQCRITHSAKFAILSIVQISKWGWREALIEQTVSPINTAQWSCSISNPDYFTQSPALIEGFAGKRALGFLLKIELCGKRSKFRMQFR